MTSKVILFFWASYFSIIFITNSIDLLKHFGLIPRLWKLTSDNYNFLVRVTSAFRLSSNTLIPAFILAIFLELVTALCFWKTIIDNEVSYLPFATGLTMFGGFILIDELLISYLAEVNHFRIFNALLLSLIAVKYIS